jgi:hypothetical protein
MDVCSAVDEKQRWLRAQASVKSAIKYEKNGEHSLAEHALVVAYDSVLDNVQMGAAGIIEDDDVECCHNIMERSLDHLTDQYEKGQQVSNNALCLQLFSTVLFIHEEIVPIGISLLYNAHIFVQLSQEPHHLLNLPGMGRSKCLWIQAILLIRLGNSRKGLKFMDRALQFTHGLAVRTMREEFLIFTNNNRADPMVRIALQETNLRRIILDSTAGGTWLTKCFAYLSLIELANGDYQGHVTLGRMEENRAIGRSHGLQETPHDTALCKWLSSKNMLPESVQQEQQPRFLYRDFCVRCKSDRGALKICGQCKTVQYCSAECQRVVSQISLLS